MRRVGDNKAGLEMALTTVILIVMSIAVLTVLVIFFNSQTGFLFKWFKTNSGKANVDQVVSSCNSLVTVESSYAYCCDKKEVVLDNGTRWTLSCDASRKTDIINGRIDKLSCEGIVCATDGGDTGDENPDISNKPDDKGSPA